MIREEQTDKGLVRYFLWNDKEYSCLNEPCFRDDAITLLRVILQQAVNDYVKLSCKKLTKEEDKFNFQTAAGFLFDDDYYINYGGMDMSCSDIVFYLTGSEPNMSMFREGIERQVDDRKKKK